MLKNNPLSILKFESMPIPVYVTVDEPWFVAKDAL